MNRSELAELREGQALASLSLTQAEAAALNRSRLVAVEPDGDGWCVTAEYAVGAVRCGDLVVRVTPKVGVLKVLTLLGRAHGIRGLEFDAALVGLSDDADLSSVLAVLFALEADRAMVGGPLRGYRTEDQSLPVLRGRLRMREQYLRRHGLLSPLEVTVDEWTLDTDENRHIRAATQRLLGLPDVPQRARVGLLRLDRMLLDVRLPPRGAQLSGWTPTRLNTRLHRLLHLADLVLAHTSVEHAAGGVQTQGFVVNMAWLFEKLVAQLLGELSAGLVPQQTLPLDTLGRLTIRPDLVFSDGAVPVAVADTKYKLLDESGRVPNADASQLVTYCARLGLTTGHLVYASGAPHPEPFDIVGTGVRLVVHSIDLARPIDDIEAQVVALRDRLLVDPQASSAGSGVSTSATSTAYSST